MKIDKISKSSNSRMVSFQLRLRNPIRHTKRQWSLDSVIPDSIPFFMLETRVLELFNMSKLLNARYTRHNMRNIFVTEALDVRKYSPSSPLMPAKLRLLPSWFKVVTITILSLFPYYLYGRSRFYRDPGSIFYDPVRAYERKYSLQREYEALQFLKKYDLTAPAQTTVVAREPSICGIILSYGSKRNDAIKYPLEV
jgi:hypothetical protein